MTQTLISIEDIAQLSGFDGNIDNDTINPFIFMAQNSEIKRLLGADLYAKILADFEAKTLAGDYDTIYTDYVAIILAYYTCSYYLKLGVPKVSQNGAYLVTPDKTEQIYSEDAYKMSDIYEKLAIGLELRLIEFLNTLTIPEWAAPDQTTAKNSFNWLRVK